MNEPHTDDRSFSSEARLVRIAEDVAHDFKLGGRTFECDDERTDLLAEAALSAKRRFGLDDEEWSYVRDALSGLAPPSVEATERNLELMFPGGVPESVKRAVRRSA